MSRMNSSRHPESLTLSVEEAGRLLGVSRMTAYKLASEGAIPTVRLGRKIIKVPRSALIAMLSPAI